MSVPRATDPEARNIGLIATSMMVVFVVVLAVFLYISGLSRGDDRSASAGPLAPSEPTLGASSAPTAAGVEVVPGPLPTVGDPQAALVRFRDPRYGFRLDLIETWRRAVVETTEPAFPSSGYDVVFEAPGSGARLAVSVWDDGGIDSLNLWVPLAAPGMLAVDGAWPPAAQVAGEATAIVWAPETPTTPARYAAFLVHEGRKYRLAYSAADGGAWIGEFARALVTFELADADTADVVPPLPQPAGRFFPRERLFGP